MSLHDHLREYRQTITGDFVPLIEAEQFHKLMAVEHPDELAEWVQAKTVQFIADSLTAMLRAERTVARRRAGARAFDEAAEAFESGDTDALASFRVVYVVNDDNTRRPVADMTGADHRYVAGQYEAEGKRALMLKAFHNAVAKKVGMRRTGDVFTPDTYDYLLSSFLNPSKKGDSKAA